MSEEVLRLFADGGPWMLPVAVVGVAGIGLAVANAFTRRSLATWAALVLALCLVVSMVAAAVSMSRALDYIAAGPGEQKFWSPVTIAAMGVLPPYLASILAAVGCGLLGCSRAYRNRQQRKRAVAMLLDGTVGCLLMVCFALVAHAVPAMLMGAVASEDKTAGMARGLASGVHDVVWPAVLALAALLARGILVVRARPGEPVSS